MSNYDERSMMSDYRFLEEVSDLHSSLQSATMRLVAEDTRNCHPTPIRGKKGSQELVNEAARTRVDLKFMPAGMQRHKTNTSYFSRRDRCIYWHLEIRFPLVQVTVHLERVQASTTVQQVLNAAFSWKDGHAARAVRLAPFIDATPAECEVCLQREQVPSTHDHMKHLQRQNTPGIAVKPAPQYKQPPPKAEASGNAT